MKKETDKHRRAVSFEVGDWVYLKLRPHRQQSVVQRVNQKLAARFYGPFQVKARVEEVPYKLQLPDNSRIHPVFHISMLKKAIQPQSTKPTLPSRFEVELESSVKPERVISQHTTSKNGKEVHQWLVKWENKEADEASWEDEVVLKTQFPDCSLEDKTAP